MFAAQKLGRYYLLDRIAIGGMAEIFRAQTTDSEGKDVLVAIKRVLSQLAEDDEFLQMLVDEAKIATTLDHPNIARVYEFVRTDSEYFIAMEYVDGKDLRSIIDRCSSQNVRLETSWILYIMISVLDGLHAAHDQRDATGSPLHIVHRDVSPSNVLVSYTGAVKLCDFGIAKARLNRVRTRTGVIKGKVRYMSPEQTTGRKLDRRSDIFSAGTVMYELLTQHVPFEAEAELDLLCAVRDARYPAPTIYRPDLHPDLVRILERALTRSRRSRYSNAQDFARDLRKHLQNYHPDFSVGPLQALLEYLFAGDIERGKRRLKQFAIGANVAEAETLDEDLDQAPNHYELELETTPVGQEVPTSERTIPHPRVPEPESRLPEDVDLFDMKTDIFDPVERKERILMRKKRRTPGATYHEDKERDTEKHTGLWPPMIPDEEDTVNQQTVGNPDDTVQEPCRFPPLHREATQELDRPEETVNDTLADEPAPSDSDEPNGNR
jgi:eukaryotic-like serine/threonine-protein kinase